MATVHTNYIFRFPSVSFIYRFDCALKQPIKFHYINTTDINKNGHENSYKLTCGHGHMAVPVGFTSTYTIGAY